MPQPQIPRDPASNSSLALLAEGYNFISNRCSRYQCVSLRQGLTRMPHLPRLQLVEIHEQPWCPPAIRDGATDCLNLIATVARQYDRVTPLLAEAVAHSRARRIVDLCSGGGGPWQRLAPRLAGSVGEVMLTDLYPNERAPALAHPDGLIRSWPAPVDACHVPPELTGFRTIFTGFHHFAPPQARTLIQNAVDQGQGIAIFEQTRRSLLALVVMFSLPWIALLAAPFIRPWRASRLVWTYLIPAIPFVLLVDGIVSCLRSYDERELAALIRSLAPPPGAQEHQPYHWRIGRVPSLISPIGVTYAVGHPVLSGEDQAWVTAPRVARTT